MRLDNPIVGASALLLYMFAMDHEESSKRANLLEFWGEPSKVSLLLYKQTMMCSLHVCGTHRVCQTGHRVHIYQCHGFNA